MRISHILVQLGIASSRYKRTKIPKSWNRHVSVCTMTIMPLLFVWNPWRLPRPCTRGKHNRAIRLLAQIALWFLPIYPGVLSLSLCPRRIYILHSSSCSQTLHQQFFPTPLLALRALVVLLRHRVGEHIHQYILLKKLLVTLQRLTRESKYIPTSVLT